MALKHLTALFGTLSSFWPLRPRKFTVNRSSIRSNLPYTIPSLSAAGILGICSAPDSASVSSPHKTSSPGSPPEESSTPRRSGPWTPFRVTMVTPGLRISSTMRASTICTTPALPSGRTPPPSVSLPTAPWTHPPRITAGKTRAASSAPSPAVTTGTPSTRTSSSTRTERAG